jgi:hypothetical protein
MGAHQIIIFQHLVAVVVAVELVVLVATQVQAQILQAQVVTVLHLQF